MIQKELLGVGASAPLAGAVAGSIATGLTAAGTTQATALALSAANNQLSTVGANSGVVLPQYAQPGDEFWVRNDGANAVLVYPPLNSSGTINAGAANAGFSVANAVTAVFKMLTSIIWVAVTSA